MRGQGIDPNDFSRKPYTQFATWLGETKSVEGCPANCRYCFLKLDGQTPKHPKILLTPKKTVDALSEAKTFHPEMPIHFGSQTDIFSTAHTIEYYSQILKIYGRSKYPNPLIIITKRSIPDEFIDLATTIPQKVVFFISYSGLGGTVFEPTINNIFLRNNFVRLKKYGLPVVHYWRPFLPQNSQPDRIVEVLKHTSRYSIASVANGLRLNDGIRKNIAPYWPELMNKNYDFSKTGEFWPLGVRSYLKKYIKRVFPNYPLFFSTPCAVALALDKPDLQGSFQQKICQKSQCPVKQRKICADSFQVPTLKFLKKVACSIGIEPSQIRLSGDKVKIIGGIETEKLVYLKSVLRFPVVSEFTSYKSGHNWANIVDEENLIEVPWK